MWATRWRPRLVTRLDGEGYLVGDSQYDSNLLYAAATPAHQVVWRLESVPGGGSDTGGIIRLGCDRWNYLPNHSDKPYFDVLNKSNATSVASRTSGPA